MIEPTCWSCFPHLYVNSLTATGRSTCCCGRLMPRDSCAGSRVIARRQLRNLLAQVMVRFEAADASAILLFSVKPAALDRDTPLVERRHLKAGKRPGRAADSLQRSVKTSRAAPVFDAFHPEHRLVAGAGIRPIRTKYPSTPLSAFVDLSQKKRNLSCSAPCGNRKTRQKSGKNQVKTSDYLDFSQMPPRCVSTKKAKAIKV